MTRNPPGMTRNPPGMTRNPPGMTRNPPGMTRNPPGIDQESIRNSLGIMTRNPPGMTRNDQESTGNDSLQSPTLSSFFTSEEFQLESSGSPVGFLALHLDSRSSPDHSW